MVSNILLVFFGSLVYVQRLRSFHPPQVKLGSFTTVPFADEVENLGVMLDSKSTLKPQLTFATTKVNGTLWVINSLLNIRRHNFQTDPGITQGLTGEI